MRRVLLRALALSALCAVSGRALADAPTADDICFKGKVARERLAVFVLSGAGVSQYPLAWAVDHPGKFPGLSPAWRVLADESYCLAVTGPDGKPGALAARDDGTPQCDKGDAAKLEAARGAVHLLFVTGTKFGNPSHISDADYFTKGGTELVCPTAPVVKDPWIKGPGLGTFPLRLRGSTDGLQFDRIVDKEQFSGLDRATISWGDDRTKSTHTFKLTLVAGLAVPVAANAELAPYIGYKINKSTKAGAATDVSDDTLRAGFLVDFFSRNAHRTNFYLGRTEYAANRVERSEIVSETLSWVPERRWLNEYAINIRDQNQDSLFSIMPLGDIRATVGTFVKQGTRADDDSRDFLRVGFQGGASLKSDLAWLPLQFTATETFLHGLAGFPRDLSQLKLVLSANLGKDKLFGIDLGYARGRIEDLAAREDGWTIAFGARF